MHKFILSWNSTCFGQFVCPSSGVYSLYTQQWYMPYRFVDSCLQTCRTCVSAERTVQWINSWWWADEVSETCRVSWQNKLVKLVHLFGFITKKFVTMYGHMNLKFDSRKLAPASQPKTQYKTRTRCTMGCNTMFVCH